MQSFICICLTHNYKQSTKSQLQASCIELLQVMLEETNERSSELAQGISEDLDADVLLETMLQLEVRNSCMYVCI